MKCQNFPLSIAQEDVLHECLVAGNSPSFNIGGTIELCNVEKDKIISSHKHLIASNDVFRLNVIKKGEEYFQYLSDVVDNNIELVDLRGASDPVSEAKRLINEEFEIPISFLKNTLHVVKLFQTGDRDFLYMGKMHHIVIDGFGFGIWAKQVIDNVYGDAKVQDTPWQEHVVAEKSKMVGKRYAKSKEYWEQNLCSDFLPVFTEKEKNKRSKRLSFRLSDNDIHCLKMIREKAGWTFPQQLLSMISVLISQRFNVKKLLVNEVYHNRRNSAQKSKIGFFAGISPIVFDFENKKTFKDIVEDCSQYQKEKFRLQNIGKKEIVNIMRQNELLLSEHVSFNYIKMQPFYSPSGDEIALEYYPHNHESLPFRVNVWEEHGGNSISLEIDFNLGFLSESEVITITELLIAAIHKVHENQHIELNKISTLTKDEEKKLVKYGNLDIPTDHNQHKTITDMLLSAVSKNPDGVSLSHAGKSLTYRDLLHKSIAVANEIRHAGLNPGGVIAIEADKTIDYMIQVWGIWLSGCTIVPIDKSSSQNNVEHMLKDSKACGFIVWGERSFVTGFERGPFPSDSDNTTLPITQLKKLRNSNSLAYVMYTSGSTGVPKGVRIVDRNLSVKMYDSMEDYKLGSCEKVLQFCSLVFDISMEEIFLSVCTMGTLVLPEGDFKSLDGFTSCVVDNEITTVNTPTAFFHHFAGNISKASKILTGSKLKRFIVAGESLQKVFAEKWLSEFPEIELFNSYGPTETTVKASFFKIKPEHFAMPEIPIGKPYKSNSLAILSSDLQPLPCGVTGDLYIGGDIVSPGYTDESRNAPFQSLSILGFPKSQWYKSGDLAFWDKFGNVVFQGRNDDQFKISGYRTSLSDITSILHSVKGVNQAYATHEKTENIIYAFILKEEEANESVVTLEILKEVPHFVHPVITFVNELPKTVTGKVDRKTLLSVAKEKGLCVAETPTEKVISGLLSKYITGKSIDITRTLYQMGGTSLQLISLSRDIGNYFGFNVPVDKIMELQTVRKIASYIDNINSIKGEAKSDNTGSGFSMTI